MKEKIDNSIQKVSRKQRRSFGVLAQLEVQQWASTNKNRRAKPAYGLVFLTLGNYPKLLTGLISVLSVVPRSISSISSISG
ncbi:MAG: hypothetical protein UX72_C0040G0004 [Parcubacteria group bacterium GW2011_GWA2_47_10]|nr:MAG: hypothetical protein UX72_C0040G0004 [Parcubacteria group bacterium GW2011_GWA2_47_10]